MWEVIKGRYYSERAIVHCRRWHYRTSEFRAFNINSEIIEAQNQHETLKTIQSFSSLWKIIVFQGDLT